VEAARKLNTDASWLQDAQGKAVKIVAPLLPHLPLGGTRHFRIIFLERNLDEIVASQAAMLHRLEKDDAPRDPEKIKSSYLRLLAQANEQLEGQNTPTLCLSYAETIAHPTAIAARINAFVGGQLDETAMAKAVDPSLHRQKFSPPPSSPSHPSPPSSPSTGKSEGEPAHEERPASGDKSIA
jgi:hypothetical protein